MLFSLALLLIIQCELNLYTGKIGFCKLKELPSLLKILEYNFVGAFCIMVAVCLCSENLMQSVELLSEFKFNQSIFQLFTYGFLCGILMFVAVYCKNKVITIFCIMAFILSGFEHCIADFPYLIFNFSLMNIIKFIFIIFGNSLGSIIANKLITGEQ